MIGVLPIMNVIGKLHIENGMIWLEMMSYHSSQQQLKDKGYYWETRFIFKDV